MECSAPSFESSVRVFLSGVAIFRICHQVSPLVLIGRLAFVLLHLLVICFVQVIPPQFNIFDDNVIKMCVDPKSVLSINGTT